MCCIAGKAGMLPHTGLFLLWKVALQMRIRRRLKSIYSELTLNQYGVASPCRTICTVCGFVALS